MLIRTRLNGKNCLQNGHDLKTDMIKCKITNTDIINGKTASKTDMIKSPNGTNQISRTELIKSLNRTD